MTSPDLFGLGGTAAIVTGAGSGIGVACAFRLVDLGAAVCMRKRGGAIVNIASVAGLSASPGAAHYGAAKAALINLTRTLALEWAPRIRVNCVAPDFVTTEGTARLTSAETRRRMRRLVPLKRLGAPVDVANVVAFLASDMASFITGQTIVVDGGTLYRGRLDFMP